MMLVPVNETQSTKELKSKLPSGTSCLSSQMLQGLLFKWRIKSTWKMEYVDLTHKFIKLSYKNKTRHVSTPISGSLTVFLLA